MLLQKNNDKTIKIINSMKTFTTILALFLCFALFAQSGKVVKVKDGDTVVILDGFNFMHTIRVADIDCPEKGQPFSKKAKHFVSDEIFGKHVTVKFKNKDRYGRTIGFVFYQDKNLSHELLKNGLAWHYKYFSNDQEMADMEKTARELKIGLWSDKNPIEPYLWRKNKKRSNKKAFQNKV